MDIESLGDCPVCLEKLGNAPNVTTHCCKQVIDLQCYLKCLPKCPLCRAEQPPVLTSNVVINDWSKLAKTVSSSIVGSAVASTMIILYTTNLYSC